MKPAIPTRFPVLLLLLCVALASCGTPEAAISRRYGTLNIPEAVRADGRILLIKIPYDAEEWVNEFRQNADYSLKGRHQVVPASESIDKSYPDTATHRFVLMIRPADAKKRAEAVSARLDNYDPVIAARKYRYFGSDDAAAFFLIDRANGQVHDGGMYSRELRVSLRYYAKQISGKP